MAENTQSIDTNAILGRIMADEANQGQYMEGKVGRAVTELTDLRNQATAGKISQDDYVNALGSLMPSITNLVGSIASRGSDAANAISAPMATITNDFQKEYQMQTAASSMLGRTLTANELAQLKPSYMGPNGDVTGPAALASFAENEASDPTSSTSKLNPNNPNNTLSQYNSAVNDQFKSVLGRDATADELSHFSSLIGTNQTDAYGLQSFLKSTQEYQDTQDKSFRDDLNTQMTDYDTYAFNQMGAPQLMSQYAQTMGGQGTSPSLDYAMTDLMGKIAQNRQATLTGLSASQYGSNKESAMSDYKTSMNQYYNNLSQNRAQNNDLQNYYNQQGLSGMDYQTQQRDYQNYVNQMTRQQSPSTFDWINLGLKGVDTIANIFKPSAGSGAGA
jgi:hypothetical protein